MTFSARILARLFLGMIFQGFFQCLVYTNDYRGFKVTGMRPRTARLINISKALILTITVIVNIFVYCVTYEVLSRDKLAFLFCTNIGMLNLIILTQISPHSHMQK